MTERVYLSYENYADALEERQFFSFLFLFKKTQTSVVCDIYRLYYIYIYI